MNKTLAKIVCKIFGHIYPLKRLPLPEYLKKPRNPNGMDESIGEGAFVADTSKPCHRCREHTNKYIQGNELIDKAGDIAKKVHKGQYRKNGETPYITHPLGVAINFIGNPTLIAIALLHDVLEDTTISPEELIKEGIPKLVVDVVEILTKRDDEKYLDYILRIKNNPLATMVKIEDIRHNYPTTHKSKQERYDMALYILKGEK